MIYKANNYESLLGMEGFSDRLLKNHFGLYEGYVKNANNILENLTELTEDGKTSGPPFSEMKRRLSFELNGIFLHERYFENMTRKSLGGPDEESLFYIDMTRIFGSYAEWEKDFRSVASIRGTGWALTIYDPRSAFLMNTWLDEHHMGHVAGTFPVIVADLWEHAMLLDYGSDRKKYLDAFLSGLAWGTISERFAKALNFQESHHAFKGAR